MDHHAKEVEEGATAEDEVELAAGHVLVAQCALGRVEHVAHEHHAGVPKTEREPVEEATPAVVVRVDWNAIGAVGMSGHGHGNLLRSSSI